MGAFFWDLC